MATIEQYLSNSESFCRETASLLAFICGRDLSWIIAHPEYHLNTSENKRFRLRQKRLWQGEPLAYILGYRDFYNYRFRVSPSVLIPRPESEMIVEVGLAYAETKIEKKIDFLDLGTGSGALIISLAKELKKTKIKTYRRSQFLAVDISPAALKIAKLNAKKYNLENKINFYNGDLLAPLISNDALLDGTWFVAANLPYLTPKERRQEASIAAEPDLALNGGRDGLTLYRRLLKNFNSLLGKNDFYLMMEINPNQAPALLALAAKQLPGAKLKKMPDLNGRTRFIIAEKN